MSALNKAESQIWRQYMIFSLHLIPREKTDNCGYCSCFSAKGTFYLSWEVRLYRTILHFLNVHDSCTLSIKEQQFFTLSHIFLIIFSEIFYHFIILYQKWVL